MYNNNQNFNRNTGGAFLGETINHGQPQQKSVYLEGFYAKDRQNNITKVAPAPRGTIPLIQQFPNGVIFEFLKPMIYLLRAMAIHPVGLVEPKVFKITIPLIAYSSVLFLLMCGYVGYIKWDKVEIVRSAEGKFEEAVIDYLFTVYLFPIVVVPMTWYESRKMEEVLNDWGRFENIYKKLTDKVLPLFVGNKPLLVTIAVPAISCITMVITHITMVHFRIIQVSGK